MTRVIVHAGFHKTGTTSLQAALTASADALAPYVQIFQRRDMSPLCRTAKIYSDGKDPLELALVTYEAGKVFSDIDPDSAGTILLSAEELCGHIVGRNSVKDHSAAPAIMGAIRRAAIAVLGKRTRLAFYFSTRRKGWLESCYWQRLSRGRMMLSEREYLARFAPAADLNRIVSEIARTVAPCPVTSMDLEDMTGLLGPMDPVLDLIGIPDHVRARIPPPHRHNPRGKRALYDRLLEVNRSYISNEQAKKLRAEVLAQPS